MKVFVVWDGEYDDAEILGIFKHLPKAENVVHETARKYNIAHVSDGDNYPPLNEGKTQDGLLGYSDRAWNRRVIIGEFEVNEDIE